MITTRVFDNIADVPAQWDHINPAQSLMQSRQFWQLVEDVKLNDIRCHYLVVYDNEQVIGVAACYEITTDIAIFSSRALRSMLQRIRRWWPGFLKMKMLECGTPITINPPLIMRENQTPAPVITAVHRELKHLARNARTLVTVVRDFEVAEEQQIEVWNNLGYHVVDNLPNTYLDICWQSSVDYLAAMKSYYRSKLRRMLKKNATLKTHHRLIDNFADLSEALSRQWSAVSQNATEYDREELTPGFYRSFCERFGSASKVLLFYRGEEWVGHALLLVDGSCLRWLYFGRENPSNDGLYIYAAYTVIETAIHLGLRTVECGLTNYAIKKDLGAKMASTRMAISSPWRLLNPLTGFTYRLLNQSPRLHNHSIFKHNEAQERSNND